MAASSLPRTRTSLTPVDERTWDAASDGGEVRFEFGRGTVFVREESAGRRFVLPSDPASATLSGQGRCWWLPAEGDAWLIETDGAIVACRNDEGWIVIITGRSARLTSHAALPHADVDGGGFSFDFAGGDLLADALAGFYWRTMLPSVIERTTARDYADADGYVVSTLADRYLGTYPDVDHEFQIKGRLAAGSGLDLDVVRRMIELQLRMMREDPTQLWRNPCAVQPDGTREYHVRRNSKDGTENAEMFLVTGNIEVLESVWLYVARTNDLAWLRAHIDDVEGAASGIELYIDPRGRLWGDVYYEDQVIKDGRETMAQALAVRSFGLLSELEDLLGRDSAALRYRGIRETLSSSLREPLPYGWWDAENERFVDWVDRNGDVHDHIHLLANILPVLTGSASATQTAAVDALVERELPEFQRFPTFLSARIADYTDDEIGDGGPYDLCAAGRYWCWDAAYWRSRGDGMMLRQQLDRVAAQGADDDWVMGERYDMDHVYYVDGSPWHGAAHYYEYPCVFTWVLLHEFLGVQPTLGADLLVSPRLDAPGSVTLDQDAYRVGYTYAADRFTLENRADETRAFAVDLSGLYPDGVLTVDGDPMAPGAVVRLDAGERVVFSRAGATA